MKKNLSTWNQSSVWLNKGGNAQIFSTKKIKKFNVDFNIQFKFSAFKFYNLKIRKKIQNFRVGY